MQVNIETTEGLGRRLEITVPGSDIDQKLQARLRELARTVRLKGFRPGKVPTRVVRQRYGRQVREEIVQDVMRQGLNDAISEHDLRVAALRDLQPAPRESSGGDLTFTAELELFPELEPLDPARLKLSKPVVEISSRDVDDMLQTLREQRREWVETDQPVAQDHRVTIEYSARAGGERIPEEGDATMTVLAGSGMLFPEFEEQLMGLQAGERRECRLTFPDSFRDRQLAGKSADVSFAVTAVAASRLPEIDAEFAAAFGIHEGGVEKLREEVAANLDRERRAAINKVQRMQVSDRLAEIYADLELPQSLIQQEAESLRQRLVHEIRQAGGDESMLPPPEKLTESATRRVRDMVVLGELARQQGIEVDNDRVQQAILDVASTYEQPQDIVELYAGNENLLAQLRQTVLEEQVIDWVIEHADATPEPMNLQQLMARSGRKDAAP